MDEVCSKLTELINKRKKCYQRIGHAQKQAKCAKNALLVMAHEYDKTSATWEYWRLSNKIQVLEEILREEKDDKFREDNE